MPDLPFQFRVCRTNTDIRLLTTDDTSVIIRLIEILGIEEEIFKNIRVLFEAGTESKITVIALKGYPEKEKQNYAYSALLECDLCGVRNGFFALFKSFSGDTATLTEECRLMHDFMNKELQNANSLREFKFPSEEPFSL